MAGRPSLPSASLSAASAAIVMCSHSHSATITAVGTPTAGRRISPMDSATVSGICLGCPGKMSYLSRRGEAAIRLASDTLQECGSTAASPALAVYFHMTLLIASFRSKVVRDIGLWLHDRHAYRAYSKLSSVWSMTDVPPRMLMQGVFPYEGRTFRAGRPQPNHAYANVHHVHDAHTSHCHWTQAYARGIAVALGA